MTAIRNAGRVGFWGAQLDLLPTAACREIVSTAEDLGFRATWIGEAFAKECLSAAGILLSATSSMVIATGVANIWARDPAAARNGALTLHEAYPDRFVLGLGVSHERVVQRRQGHYARPLSAMMAYLDGMRDAPGFMGPARADFPPTVLGALGPKMLDLAADRADGAHTFSVPVEHTAEARKRLGDKWLAVQQAVVVDDDLERAEATARRHLDLYLRFPNYRDNLTRLGYDLSAEAPMSAELIARLVPFSGLDAIVERVADHWSSGADHVAVQIVQPAPDQSHLLAALTAVSGALR